MRGIAERPLNAPPEEVSCDSGVHPTGSASRTIDLMNRRVVVGLAGVGILAAGSGASLAGASAGPGVGAATPVSVPVPPGYQRVIDDTAVVAMSVPEGWVVQTAPTTAETMTESLLVPTIQAGPVAEPPACDGCSTSFPPPMVELRVFPYQPISAEADADCDAPEVVPYDDGRFVGRQEIGGGCDARIERVLASQVDAITIDVTFVSWSVDQAPLTDAQYAELDQLFETILPTIEWTNQPYDAAIDGYLANSPAVTAPPPPIPVDTVAGSQSFFDLWPYAGFRDVPDLGTEGVRGSGCRGSVELGDTIPDGLWAGYLSAGVSGTVEFDVACVYYGDGATRVVAAGTATIVDDDPDFLVVNNNTRRRVLTDGLRYVLWGAPDDQNVCVPNGAGEANGLDQATIDLAQGALAWIRVYRGAVVWVFYGCDTGYLPGG